MASIRRSLAISFGERYSTIVIQFAASLILARMLTPTEIGIFSVGSVVVGLSHALRDFGVTNYLLQERELTPERIRAAQGVTLFIGWALAALLWLLATPLAAFYGETGVRAVLQVLALNFVLLPFGSVTAALLRRDMRFDALFQINVSSAVVQSGVSVALAYAGTGFMSLAWGGVAGAVTTTIIAFYWRRDAQSWIPGLREWRRVVDKSARFSGASLLSEAGLGGPELITGRMLGFDAVGYLSRATGAVAAIQNVIASAAFPIMAPYFAGEIRAGKGLAESYQKSLRLLSVVAWSAFAVLAVGAGPTIRLLFGPQWDASVDPARLICIGTALGSLNVVTGSAIVGMGLADVSLRIQAVGQPLKLAIVVAATELGLVGVALGIAAGDAIIAYLYLSRASLLVRVSLRRVFLDLVPSALVAVISAAAAWIGLNLTEDLQLPAQLFSLASAAALAWAIAVHFLHRPARTELFRLVNSFRTR